MCSFLKWKDGVLSALAGPGAALRVVADCDRFRNCPGACGEAKAAWEPPARWT